VKNALAMIVVVVLMLVGVVYTASAKDKTTPVPPYVPNPEDAAAAASEPQRFFIPDLGDTLESVKAKITVPEVSAECREQQNRETKEAMESVYGHNGTVYNPDLSPKGELCRKGWAKVPHFFGARELGYVEMSSGTDWKTQIFFKDGVVVRVTGTTNTLDFHQFNMAMFNHYKITPELSSTTMQNGFGAKFEWPRADYDLPNGAHLDVTAIKDTTVDFLRFDMLTKEGVADEAAKREAERKKADPFGK
jgi:hypothetical protein